MKVLIAGGAGFIGSTVASACLDAGITPVILDNLSTGRVEFVRGPDLLPGRHRRRSADRQDLRRAPRHRRGRAHRRADRRAGVGGRAAALLPRERGQVASTSSSTSSATAASATCSAPRPRSTGPGADFSVDEDSPLDPLSPYARTKAMMEQMLADCAARVRPAGALAALLQPDRGRPAAAHRPAAAAARPTCSASCSPRSRTTRSSCSPAWTGRPATAAAIRDYIHVWDLARGARGGPAPVRRGAAGRRARRTR